MSEPVFSVRNSGQGGRGYRHPRTGRIVPSVTTVLKQEAKPALIQWAVDQTAAYAVANAEDLLSVTEERGYNMLRWYHTRSPLPLEDGIDLRNYHVGVLNDAANLGTGIHAWMEADIDPTCIYPDISNEPEQFYQMLGVWNDFQSRHFIEPVRTETTVWNETLGYAGTFDALWRVDGKLTLVDIKSSRGIWGSNWMQLAALRYAETVLSPLTGGWGKGKNATKWVGEFEETPWNTSEIQSYGLLHIRPDDVDNKGYPVPAYIEFDEAEDMDMYFEMFKGFLYAARAEAGLKERLKERGTR